MSRGVCIKERTALLHLMAGSFVITYSKRIINWSQSFTAKMSPFDFVYFKPTNTDDGTCTDGSESIAWQSTGDDAFNDSSTNKQLTK